MYLLTRLSGGGAVNEGRVNYAEPGLQKGTSPGYSPHACYCHYMYTVDLLHLDIAVVAAARTWDKSKPPLQMRNYHAIVTVMCSMVLTRHLLPNIA